MIIRDYEETYDPFLFLKNLQRTILHYFIIILFNPVNNHGSKKGYLSIALTSQLVLVADL